MMLGVYEIGVPGLSNDQLVQKVFNSLRARKSLIIITPEAIDAGSLWRRLHSLLDNDEFDVREVDADELAGDAPVAALSNRIDVQWPAPSTPRTVSQFRRYAALPQVLYARRVDAVAESEHWHRLWDFCFAWVREERVAPQCALVIITSRREVPDRIWEQTSDFEAFFWWGFPSALDTHAICRTYPENQGGDIESRWCESLTASLASGCAGVVPYLVPVIQQPLTDITTALLNFSTTREWSVENLEEWGASRFLRDTGGRLMLPSGIPPRTHRQLWLKGALCCTPEYGVEIHSSAIALLGLTEELRRRMWRGQVALVLPFLDQLRLGICTLLTDRYRGRYGKKTWATYAETFTPYDPIEVQAVQQSTLACQWGYLFSLLATAPHLRNERQLYNVVERARELRNSLAHYNTIEFSALRSLYDIARRNGLLVESV